MNLVLTNHIKNQATEIALCAVGLLVLASPAFAQQASPTAFNYQGTLTRFGTPVSGVFDFRFILRDAPLNGNGWGTNLVPQVLVSNGLFAATLDYGAGAFPGPQRYLDISLRTNGSASAYSVLSPTQPVSPNPYAIQSYSATSATLAINALNATSAASATNALNLGGLLATNFVLGLVPVGSVISFYGDYTLLPPNWKYCDGSLVTNFTSPMYGTTVPDLRSAFVMGTGSGASLGFYGGANYIADHTHGFMHKHTFSGTTSTTIAGDEYFSTVSLQGGGSAFIPAGSTLTGLYHSHYFSGTTDYYPLDESGNLKFNTDPGGGHDNRPSYVALHYIIRIK